MADEAAQRAGAEIRVEALVGDGVEGGVAPGEADLDLLFEALPQGLEQEGGDFSHLFLGQRMEDDDIIHPVQEFGAEVFFQEIFDSPLGLPEVLV